MKNLNQICCDGVNIAILVWKGNKFVEKKSVCVCFLCMDCVWFVRFFLSAFRGRWHLVIIKCFIVYPEYKPNTEMQGVSIKAGLIKYSLILALLCNF